MSFYAVREGLQRGIYSTWSECQAQVSGFKGAKYKKFKSQEEARAFVAGADGNHAASESAARTGAAGIAKESGSQGGRSSSSVTSSSSTASSSTASSSTASSSSDHPKCSCGVAAARQTARQGANEGKEFFACPARKCQYFKWLDKPEPFTTLSADEDDLVGRLMARDSTIVLYVDGSCAGNRQVQTVANRAGWGVLACSPSGAVLAELFGPVVTNPQSAHFLGAEVGSNNTGELCGVAEALLWLRDCCSDATAPVVLRFDSEYAAKNTLGRYNVGGTKSNGSAYKNVALIRNVQGLFSQVCARRRAAAETKSSLEGAVEEGMGRVLLKHVKAHSGFSGNERADLLAKRGCSGDVCSVGRYRGDSSAGGDAGEEGLGKEERASKRQRL